MCVCQYVCINSCLCTSFSEMFTDGPVKYAVKNESIGRISTVNVKTVTMTVMNFQ